MATFVLVHGSHGGSWIWKKVMPLLRAGGHEVYAPGLTGLSDRAHLLEYGVDLTTHITDVATLLFYEDLLEVVLVGNSYAGMVITGVAASAPERLKTVVYLDAYVPDDGESELDLWPAEMRDAILSDKAARRGLRQPPPPSAFGINDPELAAWVKARWTPHPLATYTEPVLHGNAISAMLPRVFIQSTGDPSTTLPVFTTCAAKARARGWAVYEIETGHLAMLTAPREVAELLHKIALTN